MKSSPLRNPLCLTLILAAFVGAGRTGAAEAPGANWERPRLIVLTDIGPKLDPDDAQSIVRLLLYSNVLEIKGLVASTAAMHTGAVHPEYIEERVRAYAKVRDNLLRHAPGYPTAASLLARIKTGRPEAGMRAVGSGRDSEGSEWIIEVVDRPDPRPVWIAVWGGPNVLAQALWKVKHTRSAEELAAFVAKLRVYSVLYQDDSAPWLRETFPDLFYIVTPDGYYGRFPTLMSALTLGSRYTKGTAYGVSDELPGSNTEIVSNEWLAEHVTVGHGPLGELYPPKRFEMEVDSSSFLHLIPNGLGDPEHPEWGGWGGRYELQDGIYTDTADTVVGIDGNTYTSNHATLWRWRDDFQHDLAARMDWCVKSYEDANHPPEPRVADGLERMATGGQTVVLDASASSDPDGDTLSYEWFHYPEAGDYAGPLSIRGAASAKASLAAPEVTAQRTAHVILRMRDDGDPPLTRYRRVRIVFTPGR